MHFSHLVTQLQVSSTAHARHVKVWLSSILSTTTTPTNQPTDGVSEFPSPREQLAGREGLSAKVKTSESPTSASSAQEEALLPPALNDAGWRSGCLAHVATEYKIRLPASQSSWPPFHCLTASGGWQLLQLALGREPAHHRKPRRSAWHRNAAVRHGILLLEHIHSIFSKKGQRLPLTVCKTRKQSALSNYQPSTNGKGVTKRILLYMFGCSSVIHLLCSEQLCNKSKKSKDYPPLIQQSSLMLTDPDTHTHVHHATTMTLEKSSMKEDGHRSHVSSR